MDYMAIAERLGIPFAILIMVFVAIWRTLSWLAKSVITPITASHIALVSQTEEATKTNSVTLEKVTDILAQNSTMVGRLIEQSSEVLTITKDTNNKVTAIFPPPHVTVIVKEVEPKP